MARFKEKIKAIELRKKGSSIGEIARKIDVSKSVVSLWCRNIALTKKQIDNLHHKMMSGSYKGRMIYLEKVRRERKEESLKLFNEGLNEIGKMSKRDIFISGVALYWAEGTKALSNEQTAFSNSSPKMIIFILEWFKEICGVSKDRFVIQIRINKIHKNRVKEVEQYWSQLTKLPMIQFTKTILINTVAKKVYTSNDYYGTVRITVRKGTQLRRKIIGWIEGLSNI